MPITRDKPPAVPADETPSFMPMVQLPTSRIRNASKTALSKVPMQEQTVAEAADQQMQVYSDQRVRPFAEQLRAIFITGADHQAAIDDIYARAVGNDRWEDNRTDGPPHLLQSGNAASPDDMLNFNTLLVRLAQLKNGTFANVSEANEFASLWAVLQDACVRPVTP